jgi:hypothetical protein
MHCPRCGQVLGVAAYDRRLWDIYVRIIDGRAYRRRLAQQGDQLARESDASRRGVCATCGRPTLRGITDSELLPEDDSGYRRWFNKRTRRLLSRSAAET